MVDIQVFSKDYRDQIRDYLLQQATSDPRVVAGAVVGSLAFHEEDRWSDLDLTFAVKEGLPVLDVLEDWTLNLVDVYQAVHLFDLSSGASLYRVFLLPGCLQCDLSFTPESKFGATGPNFRMVFGQCVEKPFNQPPPAQELFGYAVHHALRARFCIERGRFWQAEYWISAARDYALNLACRRLGLPASHGRGFDALPPAIHETFKDALVTSLDRQELMRTLGCVIQGLLSQAGEVQQLADRVEPQLRSLAVAWEL